MPDKELASMTFLEHLEELRSRLLRIVAGLALGYAAAILFAEPMWVAIQSPAEVVLTRLGFPPHLVILDPSDAFTIIYIKLPVLAALFLSSPWTLWQVWSFVAPGLYTREKRAVAPLILSSAGLFVLGGAFAYWVALRYGLEFLLGLSHVARAVPAISIDRYFDLFVNVILGVSILFEIPVALFFLALLRVVSARFLFSNMRYAILLIVFATAFITPTQDMYNLALFAVPMVLLYCAGVVAVLMLEVGRNERSLPWLAILVLLGLLSGTAGTVFWIFSRR
ncbi:MAG: twin-arginine translocase subunit TatC [Acidobacteria bacterium]|nr:twin-arginine translocase subunit TatC [Acidobacteriota bacterium]